MGTRALATFACAFSRDVLFPHKSSSSQALERGKKSVKRETVEQLSSQACDAHCRCCGQRKRTALCCLFMLCARAARYSSSQSSLSRLVMVARLDFVRRLRPNCKERGGVWGAGCSRPCLWRDSSSATQTANKGATRPSPCSRAHTTARPHSGFATVVTGWIWLPKTLITTLSGKTTAALRLPGERPLLSQTKFSPERFSAQTTPSTDTFR